MTTISTELVKQLRDKTGISIMQCRKALEETSGDMEKAITILAQKSVDVANKKSDRTLGAGTVASYIHSTGSVGVMVELLCETDFVAKNEEFIKLAKDIAMHAAATAPKYLNPTDQGAEAEPESVLLSQPFVKNPDLTIINLIQTATQKFGEKIELSRFVRFSVSG